MSSSLTRLDETKASQTLSSFVLIVACAATAGILGRLLVLGRYGLDFTDEGYYIIWIAEPWNYQASVSQFGFVYHPLHELLGGDLVRLRQANVLMVWGLAWILCISFFRSTIPSPSTQVWRSPPMLAVAAVSATASFAFFRYWILTPSYNSLAFQALLLTTIGLLWAERTWSRPSLMGWALIGVGGWLTFMAKPSSAAALAIVAVIYLVLAGKLVFRLVGIAVLVATGLLLASELIIDGSLHGFVTRLRNDIELGRILEGGNSFGDLLRIDPFALTPRTKVTLELGTCAVFASTFLCASKRQTFIALGLAFPLAVALVGLAMMSGIFLPDTGQGPFRGFLIWAASLGLIAAGLALMRIKLLSSLSRARWAVAISFLLLPHVFAFGTSNNYWEFASGAGLFWLLVGFSLFTPIATHAQSWRPLLPAAALAQAVALLLVYAAAEYPYRQPQPLRLNDETIVIGSSDTKLILNAGFAKYFRELSALAARADFKPHTPMIDMTGQMPTALYALGAKAIGQAWTIGGYNGSDRVAVAMLSLVSCEDIGRAWLLVEPDGPRRLSPRVLDHFALDMDRHFEVVGTVQVPAGAGGYPAGRIQQLLKPTRSAVESQTACNGRIGSPTPGESLNQLIPNP